MTRAMYVTVMGRIAEIDMNEYNKVPEFTDITAGSYYAPYVRWATDKGIAYGVGNGLFDPEETQWQFYKDSQYPRYAQKVPLMPLPL